MAILERTNSRRHQHHPTTPLHNSTHIGGQGVCGIRENPLPAILDDADILMRPPPGVVVISANHDMEKQIFETPATSVSTKDESTQVGGNDDQVLFIANNKADM